MNQVRKRLIKWLLLLPALLLLGFAGYVTIGTLRNRPMAEAATALQSDEVVAVTADPHLTFQPAGQIPTTGLILYPGGLVNARAYAPLAYDIAAQGFLIVIPPMPLNLAVFDAGVAQDIIEAHPDIEQWAIGGHSLGGAMAARFAHDNPNAVAGLILWASYPSSADDLSQRPLSVISIYGTQDGVASLEEILAAKAHLPPDTHFIEIEGGNHSQFGWYSAGLQAGDNPATISHTRQQQQIVDNTVALLEQLENNGT